MIKRWIFYLVVLIGCVVFFVFQQGWVSWLLLVSVVCLPLLSLALSLVPMLLVRPTVDCPGVVTVGDREHLNITIRSPLPLPPCSCRLRVSHSLTGQTSKMRSGERLPTSHCGQIICKDAGLYVYDFLGMFRIRLRSIPEKKILIYPKKAVMEPPKELERFLARAWQPKHGGGFSENHELRLYRPGDGLNQVHWKLSAKTGKLIIREPMVPRHGRILLTMDLNGIPAHLDRKLGQLLWMGEHLLTLGLEYEIHVLTGDGVRMLPIRCEDDLARAAAELLCCTPAESGSILDSRIIAAWQYHIGGDGHEE